MDKQTFFTVLSAADELYLAIGDSKMLGDEFAQSDTWLCHQRAVSRTFN